MINIAIAESWQAYHRPDQIKLEIVSSPIRPSGEGGGERTRKLRRILFADKANDCSFKCGLLV